MSSDEAMKSSCRKVVRLVFITDDGVKEYAILQIAFESTPKVHWTPSPLRAFGMMHHLQNPLEHCGQISKQSCTSCYKLSASIAV